MARISFGDECQQHMQQSLKALLGNVTEQVCSPKMRMAEVSLLPSVGANHSGESLSDAESERDEYEKKVLMESANRAKKRLLRYTTPGVALSEQRTQEPDKRSRDYVTLPIEALCSDEIGVSERLVFLYIYAKASAGKVDMSIRELSEGLHLAKSSISLVLSALRDAGWLSWEVPRTGKVRQNHYHILKWLPSGGEVYANFGDSPKIGDSPNIGEYPKNGDSPNFVDSPKIGDNPNIGDSVKDVGNTGFWEMHPKNGDSLKIGDSPNIGEYPKNGDNPNFGDNPKIGDNPNIGDSAKDVGNTGFLEMHPKNGDSLKIGDSPNIGEYPKNGDSPNFGDSLKIGDNPNIGDSAKDVGNTGFLEIHPKFGHCTDSALHDTLKKLINIDFKDLDLKDLNLNQNKISDYVENLCITYVDKSCLPIYLLRIYGIAFHGQSSERLQVITQLTERLQKPFGWYVFLIIVLRNSPFLFEQNPNGFKATLAWALSKDNFPKIMKLTYIKWGLKWTPKYFINFVCQELERGK